MHRPPRPPRFTHEDEPSAGFGGFLRRILSGIPWSEGASREDVFEYKIPRHVSLRIQSSNGKIDVRGEDRDDVQLIAQKRTRAESQEAAQRLLDEIRIHESMSAAVLDLEVVIPRKWNRHGSVSLIVKVPRDLRVEVVASNGKVCVCGLRSALRTRSSNGSVTVCDVVGDVEIHTSNAKIDCRCTRGRLLARSSNGKVEVDDHCGSIDASTSNGLIKASLDDLGREGVLLATSNGRIVLELPDEVDAEVDLMVDNGVIRNDRALDRATRESNGRVRGVLGRGGTPVKLRTSNGSISLK